jgi:hypothetical protein
MSQHRQTQAPNPGTAPETTSSQGKQQNKILSPFPQKGEEWGESCHSEIPNPSIRTLLDLTLGISCEFQPFLATAMMGNLPHIYATSIAPMALINGYTI